MIFLKNDIVFTFFASLGRTLRSGFLKFLFLNFLQLITSGKNALKQSIFEKHTAILSFFKILTKSYVDTSNI